VKLSFVLPIKQEFLTHQNLIKSAGGEVTFTGGAQSSTGVSHDPLDEDEEREIDENHSTTSESDTQNEILYDLYAIIIHSVRSIF
jgi:hypothetical protein